MKRFMLGTGLIIATVLPASAQYNVYGPSRPTTRAAWNGPTYWSKPSYAGPKPVQTVRVTTSANVTYTVSSPGPAFTAPSASPPTYTASTESPIDTASPDRASQTASVGETDSPSYAVDSPSQTNTGPAYTSYGDSTQTGPAGVTYSATRTETYTASYIGSTNGPSAVLSYTAFKEWDTPTSRDSSIHRILSYGSDGSMRLAATEHDVAGDIINSSICGFNQYGWSDCLNQAGEHYQLKPESISYFYSLATYR